LKIEQNLSKIFENWAKFNGNVWKLSKIYGNFLKTEQNLTSSKIVYLKTSKKRQQCMTKKD